jgi:hypothetical protein
VIFVSEKLLFEVLFRPTGILKVTLEMCAWILVARPKHCPQELSDFISKSNLFTNYNKNRKCSFAHHFVRRCNFKDRHRRGKMLATLLQPSFL